MGQGTKTLGDRLRAARTRKGLTQAELARLARVSLATVKNYESGFYSKESPKLDTVQKLAAVLEVEPSELLPLAAVEATDLGAALDAFLASDELRALLEPPITEAEIIYIRSMPPLRSVGRDPSGRVILGIVQALRLGAGRR